MKNVLILGIDGYIGWPLAIKLLKEGYAVAGADAYLRRSRVSELGGDSLTPIGAIEDRYNYLSHNFEKFEFIERFTLSQGCFYDLKELFRLFYPDVIVHLAEQPSAPWSMRGPLSAVVTQQQNVLGTLELLWAIREFCPKAHLVKLGTMGEYGTPECDIPEGRIPKECIGNKVEPITIGYEGQDIANCPMSGLLFPRTPGSFYHASKVMDTINIEFACRTWGLTATDIMQGVVYGLNEVSENIELTRFDYDEFFGTVINRFCAQGIINHPLTVYGQGGQTRGYLPLKDSLSCICIAIENPPKIGEYRTLNQFAQIFSIVQLAEMVNNGLRENGIGTHSELHIANPRVEAESHYYNPTHETLFNLGYVPTSDHQLAITKLIDEIKRYKNGVIPEAIMPHTNWR